MDQAAIEKAVADVIARVRERGDEAVIEFTRRWDGVTLTPETLRVPAAAIEAAGVDTEFAGALRRAAARIHRFHEEVKPRSTVVEDPEGATMGMRWTPVSAVGLYVPGGKASYPSTLAMTAVPARIAGVDRIVVVSPPGPDGEVCHEVLMAAKILEIGEIYRVGGAQAVAALALGTETIPRVDKIFGPGNAFVAEAKKQLYGEVGIDAIAGPSEVVVYADQTANPDWVAVDLMAQAEHDEDARATLLATSETVLEAVRRAIAHRIDIEPRRDVILRSFDRNGRFTVVRSHEEAAAEINAIAPEHLSIQVEEPNAILKLVRNAGAIYIGRYSPVAIGDYYAGPNHVLPTGGTARFSSCLSVEDFMKRTNVCTFTEDFVRRHGEYVEVLADGERLPAHRTSVALRRRHDGLGPRQGFASVELYELVEEEGDVKLNQNESPWDIPEELKDEILTAVREEHWNRYHQKVTHELRELISESLGIERPRVFIGNGSNLLLQWVFEAFAGPGRAALIPAPSFSLYGMWARLCDARVEEFRLAHGDGALEYPVDDILARIDEQRPAVTVLCLPNNPSGTELATEAVTSILDRVEEVGGWLVIDEAYREFSGAAFDRTDLAREGRRVFLMRTFSKAFAAAGLRIGYLLANDAGAQAMAKIIPPFHLNLFNAVAARVLWKNRPLFDERVGKILAERDRVMAALRTIAAIEVFDSHANFFMMRVPEVAPLHEALAAQGILVRKLWRDPLLDSCLRVNVGTREENDRLVAAVKEFYGAGGGKGKKKRKRKR